MQLTCFAILYAIWVLPGTIALRNACLGIGALLSLYPIYASRHLFLQKRALPIWLLIALFGWVIFHFFFLSQDPITQLAELNSIWKRAAIGVIFAFGMGLSLSQLANSKQSNENNKFWLNAFWVIFYIGLLAPTLIYIIKFLLTSYDSRFGIVVPTVMQMYIGPNATYVAKTAYVAFCLPVFAVALGSLLRNVLVNRWLSVLNLAYLATLPMVMTVFYFENIKNGVAYALLLLSFFLLLILKTGSKGSWMPKIFLGILLLCASLSFLNTHLEGNESWKTFQLDAKVALNTIQNQQWKYNGEKGYPLNEQGAVVSITNYERIAWAKEGALAAFDNPLGFGLVERSFGRITKLQWPDSKLHQSHSGWIDLTLGIGVPGTALILGVMFMLIFQMGYPSIGALQLVQATRWGLISLLLMWCTTEISQKLYVENLLFWIALSAGLIIVPWKSK